MFVSSASASGRYASLPAAARAPRVEHHSPAPGAPVVRAEAFRVALSPEAKQAAARPRAADAEPSDADQQTIRELERRDAEVRAHEQAHLAAAGPHARGGPTFDYQRGPDGKRYAVGGEVPIDTTAITGDPEATLAKAQTIKRAALAPQEPSAKDRSVAAKAEQMAARARAEMAAPAVQDADKSSADDGPRLQVPASRALSAYANAGS